MKQNFRGGFFWEGRGQDAVQAAKSRRCFFVVIPQISASGEYPNYSFFSLGLPIFFVALKKIRQLERLEPKRTQVGEPGVDTGVSISFEASGYWWVKGIIIFVMIYHHNLSSFIIIHHHSSSFIIIHHHHHHHHHHHLDHTLSSYISCFLYQSDPSTYPTLSPAFQARIPGKVWIYVATQASADATTAPW